MTKTIGKEPRRVFLKFFPRPKPIRKKVRIQPEQKRTDLLIPKAVFHRLVRHTTGEFRFQLSALVALHEMAEAYLIRFMQESNAASRHRKTVTVQPIDFHLVKQIRGTTSLHARLKLADPPRATVREFMGSDKRRVRQHERHPLQRVTRASILRIARRAGIRRVGLAVYQEARAVLLSYLSDTVGKAAVLAEHCGRKTIMHRDVTQAFERAGMRLYA